MPASRRRRHWLIAAILLLLLIGLGWWVYFITTREALLHAENFFFRRMTTTELTEPGRYRFYFSTNRKAPAELADNPLRFDNQRVAELTLGTFDADIQPALGLGMLVNPTEWLQNEEIDLLDIQPLVQDSFVQDLRGAVARSPHRAVLVVLHGFREAHESALRKTAFLGHVLDVDAPLLLFDWPGDQGSGLRAYRRAHRVATDSAAELVATLQLLENEVEPAQIWLLANSMGAQVVVKAFDLMYQERMAKAQSSTATDQPITHVVLTAPDVDHEQFNEQFKRQLATLAQHLTVYVSSNDRALLASRVINRGARRGESTLNPDMLEEATRLSELTSADDDLVTLVDVTPVNRTRNFHNFSLETPEFFDDLYLRLANPEAPSSRPIYRVQTPDGAVYSVLTRAR
jgi:esterase/lipase superfamily enzyme